MNSKQLGLLGELKAQYDFTKAGWNISTPLGDYCSYDFIATKDDNLIKIQLKTTEKIHENGAMIFSVTSRNYYEYKIYTNQDCDYFYLFCLENEKGFLYPINRPHSSHITIREEIPKNNMTKGINFAKDFLFENIINTLA